MRKPASSSETAPNLRARSAQCDPIILSCFHPPPHNETAVSLDSEPQAFTVTISMLQSLQPSLNLAKMTRPLNDIKISQQEPARAGGQAQLTPPSFPSAPTSPASEPEDAIRDRLRLRWRAGEGEGCVGVSSPQYPPPSVRHEPHQSSDDSTRVMEASRSRRGCSCSLSVHRKEISAAQDRVSRFQGPDLCKTDVQEFNGQDAPHSSVSDSPRLGPTNVYKP
ncbi:hypothetical protein C8F01DRAFT_512072 [Mycena amicta]|nr:hypothetical protein C8F01DRAFT_512072 [Mycena amicta]